MMRAGSTTLSRIDPKRDEVSLLLESKRGKERTDCKATGGARFR